MDRILSRPNLRERQKADTRAALVGAAAAVFAEAGYAQTTIEDLASHAGTSRATFYLHFGSKAEAMAAVIDDVRERAGPWAGALLGMLGAEVIKVERPSGDGTRFALPRQRGMGTNYISLHVNKTNIVLDFKHAASRDTAS